MNKSGDIKQLFHISLYLGASSNFISVIMVYAIGLRHWLDFIFFTPDLSSNTCYFNWREDLALQGVWQYAKMNFNFAKVSHS